VRLASKKRFMELNIGQQDTLVSIARKFANPG